MPSTSSPRLRARRGFTLTELIVAIVIGSALGAGLVKLLAAQGQFFDMQGAQRDARSVSRAALNVLLADLRMVETSRNDAGTTASTGVTAASATSLTVYVRYANGIVCNNTAGTHWVIWSPYDWRTIASSEATSEPTNAGIAHRNADGTFTYVAPGAATVGTVPGVLANCNSLFRLPANASAETLGTLTSVTGLPSVLALGTAVFKYLPVTYTFKASGLVAGATGLYRQVSTAAEEEIAAPFDDDAGFAYFTLTGDVPSATVPSTLSDIAGVQLRLTGRSTGDTRALAQKASVDLRPSVFFLNRRL